MHWLLFSPHRSKCLEGYCKRYIKFTDGSNVASRNLTYCFCYLFLPGSLILLFYFFHANSPIIKDLDAESFWGSVSLLRLCSRTISIMLLWPVWHVPQAHFISYYLRIFREQIFQSKTRMDSHCVLCSEFHKRPYAYTVVDVHEQALYPAQNTARLDLINSYIIQYRFLVNRYVLALAIIHVRMGLVGWSIAPSKIYRQVNAMQCAPQIS